MVLGRRRKEQLTVTVLGHQESSWETRVGQLSAAPVSFPSQTLETRERTEAGAVGRRGIHAQESFA